MSQTESRADWVRRFDHGVRRVGRAVVGDRTGLGIFLAILVWSVALWRIGFFIQDSVTVANALANVADGSLAIVDSPYALTLGSQPGLVEVDGTAYGRNYGHVLASLPILWVLDGLALVADLRLVVAAGWSLLVVALGWNIARLTGDDRFETWGSLVALGAFLANVAAVEPLPAQRTELMALQVSTMLAAALLGTVLYRLVSRFHGRRVGVVAGLGVVIATPVGFWTSIPKRHILTAAAVVAILYCFAVSRSGTDWRHRLVRAGAYATVGFLTTLHPFEALFLFLVFVPLDLLTAPTNDWRTLGVVGGVFCLTLLPFFALNTLISGNPLKPPRMLSPVGTGFSLTPDQPSGGGGEPNGGGNAGNAPASTPEETGAGNAPSGLSGSGGSGDGTEADGWLPEPVRRGLDYTDRIVQFVTKTVESGFAAVQNPTRLYHTFVRSGRIPLMNTSVNNFEAIELALLESFPLAAALFWLPVAAGRRVQRGLDGVLPRTPERQTDLLAACFALVFTFVYLPRLPLVSQITLRYLLPVMPLLAYGVVRLSVVRETIESVPRLLAGGYLVTVVAGGALVTAGLAALDPAIGEAMQFHALLGLATAVVAVVCLCSWPLHRERRAVAAGLALPAGTTTVFLLLTGVEYFHYKLPGTPPGHEPFALDVVRVIAELIPIFPP